MGSRDLDHVFDSPCPTCGAPVLMRCVLSDPCPARLALARVAPPGEHRPAELPTLHELVDAAAKRVRAELRPPLKCQKCGAAWPVRLAVAFDSPAAVTGALAFDCPGCGAEFIAPLAFAPEGETPEEPFERFCRVIDTSVAALEQLERAVDHAARIKLSPLSRELHALALAVRALCKSMRTVRRDFEP